MSDEHYYTWQDLEKACYHITRDMKDWRPDYIVGIVRGGMPLAVTLSNFLDIPCYALKVNLRDHAQDNESNCWMAEDALGHPDYMKQAGMKGKNILIVDDINDSGATFDWIKQDWSTSNLPNHEGWKEVWGNNVRFAVMTENLASSFGDVSYYYHEVNKSENPVWLVYPWENL